MKIENIQASRYRVPVTIPLRDKPRFIDVVLTCVETDTGLRGYSVTDVYGPALTATINEEIAPYLRGANPLETEKIWQDLYTKFNIRCLTGLWSSVASMIDIALWDIKGKHFGEPVFRLLGGAHDRAQAYITFGMGEYSREELVEVAKMLVAQGHTRLKMVVAIQNATNLREDAARVKAVREAVGDGIELMVDANYLFSLPQAVELCKLIEPCNISFFEEPVYGNDFRLLRDLRRKTTIPIAAGQQFGHLWQHRELIVEEAVDIAQPNVCFVGGFTEAVKVANLARAFNKQIANGGTWPFHNVHLQAGMVNGTKVEFHLVFWRLCEVIFKEGPKPENGWVTPFERPGLGLEPNFELLEQYRIK